MEKPPTAAQDPELQPTTTGRRPLVASAGGLWWAAAALERLRLATVNVRPERAAVALGGLIVLFTVLGSLYHLGAPLELFNLDSEGRPPAAFSGALMICAGTLGWMNGGTAAERGFRRRWRAVGTLFLFVGVDEILTIHESLADLAGVFWQLLYVPLGLLGATVWLLVLGRLSRDRPERLLFICAPAAWMTSQLLETIQNEPSDRVGGYAIMATAEESLEMVGSTLFLLALLIALQRRSGAEPPMYHPR